MTGSAKRGVTQMFTLNALEKKKRNKKKNYLKVFLKETLILT